MSVTLRHDVELQLIAIDNRAPGNISAVYTLAKINLHFITFLFLIIRAATLIRSIRQTYATTRRFLCDWSEALQPPGWRSDLRIIAYAAVTLFYPLEVSYGP